MKNVSQHHWQDTSKYVSKRFGKSKRNNMLYEIRDLIYLLNDYIKIVSAMTMSVYRASVRPCVRVASPCWCTYASVKVCVCSVVFGVFNLWTPKRSCANNPFPSRQWTNYSYMHSGYAWIRPRVEDILHAGGTWLYLRQMGRDNIYKCKFI